MSWSDALRERRNSQKNHVQKVQNTTDEFKLDESQDLLAPGLTVTNAMNIEPNGSPGNTVDENGLIYRAMAQAIEEVTANFDHELFQNATADIKAKAANLNAIAFDTVEDIANWKAGWNEISTYLRDVYGHTETNFSEEKPQRRYSAITNAMAEAILRRNEIMPPDFQTELAKLLKPLPARQRMSVLAEYAEIEQLPLGTVKQIELWRDESIRFAKWFHFMRASLLCMTEGNLVEHARPSIKGGLCQPKR